MKTNFIFVFLLMIILFKKFNANQYMYNIKSHIPINIPSISSEDKYFFRIDVNEEEKVDITLTMNYTDSGPFTEVYINEYDRFYGSLTLRTYQTFSKEIKDNKLIISLSYKVSQPLTNIISLEIQPSLKIDCVVVLFDALTEFNLIESGIPTTIYNLVPEKAYYFYLNISQFSKLDITMKMDNKTITPFNYIYFYEYPSIKTSFLDYNERAKFELLINSTKSESVSSFSYNATYFNTGFIAFKLIPSQSLNHLSIKLDIIEFTYKLSNGLSRNITNLLSNNEYFLFIKAKTFEMINVTLTMKDENKIPFSYLYLNHYVEEKASCYNSTYQPISSIAKNGQLISSFSYLIMEDLTGVIALKIKPLYNINYLNIKIDVENHAADFFYGNEKDINNLRAGNKYYLILYVSEDLCVSNIDLIMNERDNIPISYLNYYEYFYYSIGQYVGKTTKEVKVSKKNNKLQLSSSYKLKNKHINNLIVEIIPDFDIDSLKAIVIISESYLNLILIISGVILAIIIVVIIICICKKKKANNIDNKIKDMSLSLVKSSDTPHNETQQKI